MTKGAGSKKIPSAPDILSVAAQANDDQDPIAVIQAAVDEHHQNMVEIIEKLQMQLMSSKTVGNQVSTIDKSEDRALAMQFLDGIGQGKAIRRFDPNTRKGSYTGAIVHITQHHVIQSVGAVSYMLHDRESIEGSIADLAVNDRLQIRYSSGKCTASVIDRDRSANVNEAASNMPAHTRKAIQEAMKDDHSPEPENDQDREV